MLSCYIFFILCKYCTSNQVSFTTYSLSELPLALYDHISVLYDDEIHLIAGKVDFSGTLSNYTYIIPLTSSLPITSIPMILPSNLSSTIYCSECYAVFNDKVYFVIGGVGGAQGAGYIYLYLLQYNLITKSFENPSTYFSTVAIGDSLYRTYITHTASCVIYDAEQYLHVLIPSDIYDNIAQSEWLARGCGTDISRVSYDTINDEWLCSKHPQLNVVRYAFSCGLATNNYDVYIFGGSVRGYDTNIIEEWNMITNEVQIIGRMQYTRSSFSVSVTSDNYIIIGNTLENDTIEIFDANDKVMMHPTEDINEIIVDKRSSYAMFIDESSNELMINGGYDENNEISTEIIHISVDDIFDVAHNLTQDTSYYSCITRYETESTSLYIDTYLYSDTHQLLFALNQQISPDTSSNPTLFEQDATIIIYDETFHISNTSLSQDYKFEIYELTGFVIYPETFVMNLNPNIELLWISWHTINDVLDGMPLFRFGIGDSLDEYELLYASKGKTLFVFDDMEPISLSSTASAQWSFYHNLCDAYVYYSNSASVISNVSVHDFIPIQLDLMNATSLNTIITITSTDIIGIHYDLIFEDEYICLWNYNTLEQRCNLSTIPTYIEIAGFTTYDLDFNAYQIHFESVNDELRINGDDHNATLVLHRNVMEVEVFIDLGNGTNDDYDLHPGSSIMIYPIFDETKASQPNGTIFIYFDDDLSFSGAAIMLIDFYADECIIEYDELRIDCYDEFITIPSDMKQKAIPLNMYTVKVESADVYLIGETAFKLTRYIQEISLNISKSIYLGEMIRFHPYIVDESIVQSSSSVNIYSAQHLISYTVHLIYDTTNEILCEIETSITKLRRPCDDGIAFQTADLGLITNEIQLLLETNDTILNEYNISIQIEHCPIGKGVIGSNYNLSSYSCTDCPVNEVSLWSNSECVSCSGVSGVTCFGSSSLIVSFNHWIAVQDHEYAFDLFQDENALIISTFCPTGFCCNDVNGCDFAAQNEMCGSNRDPQTPLCGSCVEGYSEVLGSTSCKQCRGNNWFYLLIPFVISIFVVLLLIILDPPPVQTKDNAKEINYAIYLAKDDLKALQISILRPCLYFYQGVAFVTIQNGLFFYLTPMIKILSFDFLIESDSDDGGVCFLQNMNSMTKLLWSLFFPFCMCFALLIIKLCYLLSKHVCYQTMTRINFGWNVVFAVLLIFIGNAVSTMMKMLSCSQIGSIFVHFHAGYLECYGLYFNISLFVMMILIFFWIFVWFLLFRMHPQKRDSRRSYLRTLTKPYKLELWWWEILMLSRRVLISFLATFQYVEREYIQYILIVLLIFYLMLQVHHQPFTYKRVNIMEMLCLSMLIFCLLSINILQSDRKKHYETVSIMMSIIVLAPILLFVFYIMQSIKHMFEVKALLAASASKDAEKDDKLSKKIEKMRHRLTTSQQMPFDVFNQSNFEEKQQEKQVPHIEMELNKVMSMSINEDDETLVSTSGKKHKQISSKKEKMKKVKQKKGNTAKKNKSKKKSKNKNHNGKQSDKKPKKGKTSKEDVDGAAAQTKEINSKNIRGHTTKQNSFSISSSLIK